MSKRGIFGTALGTTAAAALLFASMAPGGSALASAPKAATATPKATTSSKGASTKKATPTKSATSPSASAATATASSPKTPVVSATSTKKVAAAAAQTISPAVVNVLATNSTTGAAGTGIVLTSTGEVLTNYHVITGATRITATDIGTGRTYRANVVGYDAADDIAVLQLVGASGLPTAKLATTDAGVGQTVVAVGNANGLGGTPSYVSGTVTDDDRSVIASNDAGTSSESLTGMLQTTTPIVPGYSGGPLVNAAGEVVGMDTSGSFTSMSKPATAAFAIPIDTALDIVHQIVSGQASAKVTIG